MRFRKSDFAASVFLGFLIGMLASFILSNLGKHYAFQNYLFAIFAVLAPLGLYTFAFLSRWMPSLFQLGKFIIVGSANFFVDLGVFHLVISLSGSENARTLFSLSALSITTWTAFKAISFVVAITNSFLWNKFWTFQEKKTESAKSEYLSFLAVSLVGMALNTTVFSIVFSFRSGGVRETVWATVAAVAGTFAGLGWNFVGYKFFVFKK